MITDTINKRIAEALKAKDEIRLSTLRMLSAELHNAKIDKREALNKDEELVVVKKEAKKRKDAIEAYEKAGATEKAELEKKELEILQEYLPEELPDEEIEKLVASAIDEVGASSVADMGKVMGVAMKKIEGEADGNRVSAIVKEKLS